jgi:hypothetical protein
MGDATGSGVAVTTWLRPRAPMSGFNPFGHCMAYVRASHADKAITTVRPEGRPGGGPG